MRVIFAGSSAIAVPSLEALASGEGGAELIGVLTNPDTPKGRSGTREPTDIGMAAQKLGVPVVKPAKLDMQARAEIADLKPDLLVSFAYGRIFGPKFLALFPLGGINIHPSLLPKYRGPTPIQAAILNRDSITGISIQKTTLEIDSGDILAAEQILLTGSETAAVLGDTVSVKAAGLLPLAIKKIACGENGTPQDHSLASFCPLISRQDGLIDWGKSALEIEAKIRAYCPWPLCRTIHNGRELFILKASVCTAGAFLPKERETAKSGQVLGIDSQYGILIQTGDGILAVTELQYSGKKVLFWKDFLNGARGFLEGQL